MNYQCTRCGRIKESQNRLFLCKDGPCPMEPVLPKRPKMFMWLVGFGCAALIAGIAYVVIVSDLFDFIRGKW